MHLAKRQPLNLKVGPCLSLLLLFVGCLYVKRTSLAERAGPKGVYLRERVMSLSWSILSMLKYYYATMAYSYA